MKVISKVIYIILSLIIVFLLGLEFNHYQTTQQTIDITQYRSILNENENRIALISSYLTKVTIDNLFYYNKAACESDIKNLAFLKIAKQNLIDYKTVFKMAHDSLSGCFLNKSPIDSPSYSNTYNLYINNDIVAMFESTLDVYDQKTKLILESLQKEVGASNETN